MIDSEKYERTINYKAVFIFSLCAIWVIYSNAMPYFTRIRLERRRKEWALQNVQKISDYLMKHGKVPFYQIYLNREELGLRLIDFASEYHRPTYRKALEYESPKGILQLSEDAFASEYHWTVTYESPREIPQLSEKEFAEICCFVLEYDKVTNEYKLYDKYNPEISRMFRIEKKEVER